MRISSIVLCILGAIVGAGFASGREILHFFSAYGAFSWALIGLAAGGMTGLILRVMKNGAGGIGGILPGGRMKGPGEMLLIALLCCTVGGMTAAAGELAALTLPLHYARGLGLLVTLTGCLWLTRRPLGAMNVIARMLLPVLVIALALCLRNAPAEAAPPALPSVKECAYGALQALGYAGLNVTLAAGILCDAGARCGPRGICRAAVWTGGAIGALLLLGNAALLPYAQALRDEPLPTVQLLRVYGKPGYYLAAGALYLAVATTLIAVLRALCALLRERNLRFVFPLVWVATGAVALCGFERIVSLAYPILGFLCFLALAWRPRKERGRGESDKACARPPRPKGP